MRPTLRRTRALLLCAALLGSQSACLGTLVESPARARAADSYATLRWHLIAAPRSIDATECPRGMSDVFTHVPLWGLALGVLTFGILVPQWTIYSCAE